MAATNVDSIQLINTVNTTEVPSECLTQTVSWIMEAMSDCSQLVQTQSPSGLFFPKTGISLMQPIVWDSDSTVSASHTVGLVASGVSTASITDGVVGACKGGHAAANARSQTEPSSSASLCIGTLITKANGPFGMQAIITTSR